MANLARTLISGVAALAAVTISVPATAGQVRGEPESMTQAGIPGPRSCFWLRGPVSADPYVNIAYPDANTFYWSASFTIPEGARLTLDGAFPHARYMSFISYDEGGRPYEALADYLIAPKPGSTNPFRPGAARAAKSRDYSIEVIDAPTSEAMSEGREVPGAQRQVLRAAKYGPGQQTILYRIYANDLATPVTGGVGLPAPVLTMADGRVLRGTAACQALNASQMPRLNVSALGLPPSQYRALISQPGKPDTWPAQVDPKWYIQLDRPSLIGIYTGEINPNARRSEGGFYPNPDNNYIRTVVNTRLGPVIVMRGKAPTAPRTVNGDKVMGSGDVRYWSVCSNQGFANTRVNDCIHDEEIPVNKDGYYTIIISKAKDRPRNARPECGLQWLPIADDGDGAFDDDVGVIQIRHLLAKPDFTHAIQAIPTDDQIGAVMGDYAPKMRYAMPNAVEVLYPCPLSPED